MASKCTSAALRWSLICGVVTQVWRLMVLGLSQAFSVAISVAPLSVQHFRDSLLIKHTQQSKHIETIQAPIPVLKLWCSCLSANTCSGAWLATQRQDRNKAQRYSCIIPVLCAVQWRWYYDHLVRRNYKPGHYRLFVLPCVWCADYQSS